MEIIDDLNKKKPILAEDISKACEWVVTALDSSGYNADHSLESMKEIDRFIEEQSGENGIISRNRGRIIFALGCYVGETVIKLYGGEWITDDDDPEGEINISVKLDGDVIIFPVQRVIKRYQNGSEDGIYAYVYVLSPDKTKNKAKNKTTTLYENIHTACELVVSALNSSDYNADYSIESLKEIDRFIDEQSGEDGLISRGRGKILFALGCYVGETVIRLYGGKWYADDNDPAGEIKAYAELDNGTVIFPMQKVLKRYRNGSEDGIYAYVCALALNKTKRITATPYEDINRSIVVALNWSGYKADYTIESLKEIDRFIDEQSGGDGMITLGAGEILFSLGCYVAETVIHLYGGEWRSDDNDPKGEMNASVKLDNGTVIFPMQTVLKRYQNGSEDSIYAYVYTLSQKS